MPHQQGFRKFNGSRWSLFDHNSRITCWFFPYCLCRFQGKGQRLVCGLPQVNYIAAGLQRNWKLCSTTIGGNTWNLAQLVFILMLKLLLNLETTSVLVQCSRYVQYIVHGDETGCCDRRFCCWWRGSRQQKVDSRLMLKNETRRKWLAMTKTKWLWPRQRQDGTTARDGETWLSACLLLHWRLNTLTSLRVSQTHPTVGVLAYLLNTRQQELSW